MPHIHDVNMATRFARGSDHVLLHTENSFRVLTFLAENKLLDEPVELVLHLASVVAAVDNVSLCLDVRLGLGAKFAAKVLGDVGWRPSQCPANVHHIHNNSLDPVSLSLNLGEQPWHLVPVEGILDIPIDVESHLDNFSVFPQNSRFLGLKLAGSDTVLYLRIHLCN